MVVIGMDSQLLKRLNTVITHFPCEGISPRLDKTFGLPIERKCYDEGKVTTVRNIRGDEVITSYRLYFDGLFSITGDDEILLNGKRYPVAAYARYPGLRNNTGTTVVYV